MTHLHGNSPRFGVEPILTGKTMYNEFTSMGGSTIIKLARKFCYIKQCVLAFQFGVFRSVNKLKCPLVLLRLISKYYKILEGTYLQDNFPMNLFFGSPGFFGNVRLVTGLCKKVHGSAWWRYLIGSFWEHFLAVSAIQRLWSGPLIGWSSVCGADHWMIQRLWSGPLDDPASVAWTIDWSGVCGVDHWLIQRLWRGPLIDWSGVRGSDHWLIDPASVEWTNDWLIQRMWSGPLDDPASVAWTIDWLIQRLWSGPLIDPASVERTIDWSSVCGADHWRDDLFLIQINRLWYWRVFCLYDHY